MSSFCRQWATGPCFYCGRPTFRCAPTSCKPYKYTRDHIVPRSEFKRVADLRFKLVTVTCCNACNIRKGVLAPRVFIDKHIAKKRRKHIDWATIDRAYEVATELINPKPQAAVPVR